MKVAVPRSQHSPTFGQFASSQTVWSPSALICRFSSRNFGPPGAGTLSQGGLRCPRNGSPWTFSIAIPPGRARERVLCSRSAVVSGAAGAATGGGVLTPTTLARVPRASPGHVGGRHEELGLGAERPVPRLVPVLEEGDEVPAQRLPAP